jgi:hypothetical protein
MALIICKTTTQLFLAFSIIQTLKSTQADDKNMNHHVVLQSLTMVGDMLYYGGPISLIGL